MVRLLYILGFCALCAACGVFGYWLSRWNRPDPRLEAILSSGGIVERFRKWVTVPSIPGYATASRSIVPFNRNLSNYDLELGLGSWNNYQNCSDWWEYWIAHMVACWQGPTAHDNDPGTEDPKPGATSDITYDAAVFVEVIRDGGAPQEKVIAHELGHTAGLGDCSNNSCLMYGDLSGGNTFCAQCRLHLRNRTMW
jgi:hypothetical protein